MKLQLEHKVLYQLLQIILAPVELIITQVDDHVKIRLASQLINSISRVLQKLLKYFNGAVISTSFIFPPAGVFSVMFTLDLRNSESSVYHLPHLCNIAINLQMILNNYQYILSSYTLTLLYQFLWNYLFLYYSFHFYN